MSDLIKTLRDALVDAKTWHQDMRKSCSKQPPSAMRDFAMATHAEQIEQIDAVLIAQTFASNPASPAWWQDEAAAEREFTEYFCRNYPGPDTVISKPEWHAPKLFRAAKHALLATVANQPPAPDVTVGRWLPIAQADRTVTNVEDFSEVGITLRTSDRYWVRDDDGHVYEAAWSEGEKSSYWWDFEGESPVDPVEFMPHPLDPKYAAASEGSSHG